MKKKVPRYFDKLSTRNKLSGLWLLLIVLIFTSIGHCQEFNPKLKTRGIYINLQTMQWPSKIVRLANNSFNFGINTFVCDFKATNPTYVKNLNYIKERDIYPIARIVVFEEGVGATAETAQDSENWEKKLALAEKAEKIGFKEIQFDYIRFEDRGSPDKEKKEIIERFLKEAKARVKIPVGIDVFGSVAYQPHLIIGQDLNSIADIVDVISPMLYPSHFFKDKKRMGEPYETMVEGCEKAKAQIGRRKVALVPFIQGFAMNLSYAKLTLKDYVLAQIRAVNDAGADGFYVWAADSNYNSTWQALAEFQKKPLRIKPKKKSP
jgi:hypothetical protein